MISTLVLNWNRVDLLRATLESYLDTATADMELFVIDNASTDASREYLHQIERIASVKTFYLDDNAGGAAYNIAIPFATGDLIHLSENDQLFLPGWVDHVNSAFDIFPDLGQLSLFSDTPGDGEAWEPKPSHLKFARGKILYEAHGNVGTSSVLRGELFRSHGLRIQNIEHGRLRFPDDKMLSSSVKASGYWVAWSDRYYVRNLGHEVSEFLSNPDYYRENYSSKIWLGIDGWLKRLEKQRITPKPRRNSIALPEVPAVPEKTVTDVGDKPSRLWSMFDGWTAEVEVVDFLYALTRLIKPSQVLETGTWLGLSSCAIAKALIANGFGHLTTVEVQPDAYKAAIDNFSKHEVAGVVTAVLKSSMDFTPQYQFDMALFDSAADFRVREFQRFRPWLTQGAIVIFPGIVEHLQAINRVFFESVVEGIALPTARGIFVGRISASSPIPR